MRTRLISAALALSVLLTASGCSGGSIYSNYRDIAELLVIQTVGFDLSSDGSVRLSVSAEGSSGTGGSKSPLRLCADAASVTEAQDGLRHYSGGRQLFFGHTAYIVLGEDVLASGITPFLDCIERDADLRLCIPLFAVSFGSAAGLVLGTGDSEHDSSKLMHAVTEELRLRGDARGFTAAETISALDENGSALICAVKAGAGDGGETVITSDGYTIINKGRAVGHIPMELARGVSIILNEVGSLPVTVGGATLQLDSCSCKISPVFDDGGALTGLDFGIELSAALAEARGSLEPEALSRELEAAVRGWVEAVLELQADCGCDFLHLGSVLELQQPRRLRGAGRSFALIASGLSYSVSVTASIDRSFHLELSEAHF